MKEDSFKGVGGLRIHTRCWPASDTPKAILVISHGFNSHSGHYAWVGERLSANGYAVYALDHRGRGLSEGERFYVGNLDEYVADLATFIDIVQAENPDTKVFLLGHSAGGVVACIYAIDHPDALAGLVCESFAYQVPAPDSAVALLRGLSHVAPHLHVLKLKNEDFSRDPAIVAALNADPLIADETQPAQTVAAMARADERLSEEFEKIRLPVLIIHGTEDRATRPSGSREFYERAGSTDKSLKFYEGHYHDLLSDLGREDVLDDIRNWMDVRI